MRGRGRGCVGISVMSRLNPVRFGGGEGMEGVVVLNRVGWRLFLLWLSGDCVFMFLVSFGIGRLGFDKQV